MTLSQHGTAYYSRGKMYFNDDGWRILKELAKKTHKSPARLIHEALKRYIRRNKESK